MRSYVFIIMLIFVQNKKIIIIIFIYEEIKDGKSVIRILYPFVLIVKHILYFLWIVFYRKKYKIKKNPDR